MSEQVLLSDNSLGIEVSFDGDQVSVSKKLGTSLISVLIGEDIMLVRNDGSNVIGVFVDEDNLTVESG